ncbi:MAG: hypothetical protein GX221_03080 [Candidatus Riflebacteria bacterium]|nr:hypothetical protein [Candidatus Riflebacteria bacterium]
MNKHSRRAVTLMEVMIGASVFAIVSVSIYFVLSSGRKSHALGTARMRMRISLDNAMKILEKDINNSRVLPTEPGEKLDKDKHVTFKVSGSGCTMQVPRSDVEEQQTTFFDSSASDSKDDFYEEVTYSLEPKGEANALIRSGTASGRRQVGEYIDTIEFKTFAITYNAAVEVTIKAKIRPDGAKKEEEQERKATIVLKNLHSIMFGEGEGSYAGGNRYWNQTGGTTP